MFLNVSVSAGRFNAGSISGTNITLPIGWNYKFDNGYNLIIGLPITYQQIGNSSTYQTQLDAGLQIPVIRKTLYITPVFGFGVVGSENLGSGAGMYSAALGAKYRIHISKSWTTSMQFMTGYFSSTQLSIGKYTIAPDIHNEAYKVGFVTQKTMPFMIWGEPMSARFGYAYTRLTGTTLFMNGYNQVYAGFGTKPGSGAPFYKNLRLGVVGTFGRDYSSYSMDLGYSF